MSVFTRQDFRTGLLDTLLNQTLHSSSNYFFNVESTFTIKKGKAFMFSLRSGRCWQYFVAVTYKN